MTRGRINNGVELKDLETQVRKARELVRHSELKVEAIEVSIYEIEKFYPEVKIARRVALARPAGPGERERAGQISKSAGRPNVEPFNHVQR
jgi:hypothetical protein